MYTRTELETKTLLQLVTLCNRYGLKAHHDPGQRSGWATALLSFANKAITQMQRGVGLKHPGRDGIEALLTAYNALGTPTAEQVALIKSSSEGRVMPSPYRLEQQKLLAFYEAKRKLEEAISLLNFPNLSP
ncbi:hypothetical protein BZZ01_32795 (plasmid) [Nostocales cyanobacterium HT-58-2]|nr:hypothetical protein BZZ01_32795 [Nostocales cyanobacterium HT-58-2]